GDRGPGDYSVLLLELLVRRDSVGGIAVAGEGAVQDRRVRRADVRVGGGFPHRPDDLGGGAGGLAPVRGDRGFARLLQPPAQAQARRPLSSRIPYTAKTGQPSTSACQRAHSTGGASSSGGRGAAGTSPAASFVVAFASTLTPRTARRGSGCTSSRGGSRASA